MTGDLALVVWVSPGPVGYVMTHCAQDTRWGDSGGVLGAQVGVGWTIDPERDQKRSWDVFFEGGDPERDPGSSPASGRETIPA